MKERKNVKVLTNVRKRHYSTYYANDYVNIEDFNHTAQVENL